MAKGERICVVCGTKYVYCPNCKKGDPKETWRYMYDSNQCRELFRICSDFAHGHINANEAKKRLSKYDLNDTSKYSEDIRRNLSAINASAVAEKPAEPKEEKETRGKRKNRIVNEEG